MLARGDALWNEIEPEVTPLAHELAQHLRLLLEPSKTDRLKGDYKTGKRLNMKKVIGYIASGYKKDKIWMRRTKPSSREYQIVMAIDDSSSMSQNKAGQSALSALAVLTKAMAIVEAGQVAVARFGSDIEFLQTFDDPLTLDCAASTLGRFRFDQTETNVSLLMEESLNMLDEAKLQRGPSNRTTSDLLQLMFVISDGKIQRQYREHIKRLVNRAQVCTAGLENCQHSLAALSCCCVPQGFLEGRGEGCSAPPHPAVAKPTRTHTPDNRRTAS